ncbi:two-component system sensor histidine kinase NtrB [Caballeronia terrestris]|uniref:two-component system sensor histidine kinase NtrB n=1 Tax=Caballeronia terrestris TaxID=1226301 RepID=UPI00228635B8|nr:ATP-binding protein [Caballeronia terrestris]
MALAIHGAVWGAPRRRRTQARAADCGGSAEQLPRDDDAFRHTLEPLPFAILVTNKDGEIVLANAASEKLFGYSRDDLTGASADMLVPGLRNGAQAALQIDTASGHALHAVGGSRDVFARRKGGSEFPAEITINPLTSHSEALMLTVVIDRTERHELQRNRQELAHLTRVSTLGELAGSLAHELNQPLTAILSNAQAAQRFMAMDPIDLDEVREIFHDLVADNRRASEVIRRIRALLKKGELEAAPLSLADVIGDVVLLLHSDAVVRGVRVFLNLDPALPPVHGDCVQLQQVVLNLLLNAFDAMESHSVPDREVVIEASVDDDGSVRVAVRDRGPGLADDIVEKLFTPFFTSKRDGLGLGLSISRSIVNMHGGRIWAENNVHAGAAFYFTLPTRPASSDRAEHLDTASEFRS